MKHLLNSVVHWVSWHRRLMGAVLAGFAVLLLGSALSEPDGPRESVVVLASSLPAGHTLTPSDVKVAHLFPEAVPDGALKDPESLFGRSTAVALREGSILQPTLLAEGTTAEPGRALVPITLRDQALRALLKPGDRITLVAPGYEQVEVLTSDARVAVLASPVEGSPLSMGGTEQGALILVNVPSAQAPLVAALGQDGGIRVVLGSL